MLDKNGFIPLYAQLQRILKDKIMNGEYPEGQTIPSESVLCNEYGVTRTTVRKAISNLVNEGLVEQIHGKGTFVKLKKMNYALWNFEGFTDYLLKKNEKPISKVLEQKTITIDGEPYVVIKRARGLEKEVSNLFLTIDTSMIPLKRFPDIQNNNFEIVSIYDVMRKKYQVNPTRSEIGIKPISTESWMKDIFNMEKGDSTPLLLAQGSVFSDQEEEIEKLEIIYSPNADFKLSTNF